MKQLLVIIFIGSVCALFFSFDLHASSAETKKLKASLARIVEDKAFHSAHIGISIISTKSGQSLFQHNAQKRFVSASNMKLFTSAAALLYLSPDFTYETKVLTDGTITGGTLKGNLVITASGDPTISGYFNKNNPTQVFEDWADTLMQKGIKTITGDIIVDNRYFNDNPLGAGWHWDDVDHCFSAPIDAFSFNNNCIAFTISPGTKANSPAKVEVEPKTAYIRVLPTITTGDKDSDVDMSAEYAGNGNAIILSGAIPLKHESVVKYIAVKNPAAFGAFVFKEILLSKGIEVKGKIYCTRGGCNEVKDLDTSSANTLLAFYHSPKLSEILKVVNKLSNNLYTENLFLTIAKAKQKEGNAREAALVVRDILTKAGVNLEGFYMADGSGLSRFNLITPQQTAQLLQIMASNPYVDPFFNSLAAPDTEGTLKNWSRWGTTGNIRAKTGTMTHVRNLSGYVRTKDGELLAFSFLCNNQDIPKAVIDGLYNNILTKLTSFSRK
jgi:D-alanyl-D-alanine carboxypeptidase/D-alanyl-D-alanine-endopeptidase (penicillin-binding protein 4)